MPSSHPDTMHLVGSARLEVADILESAGLAPKDDQHHLSLAPQLRDIAQEYKRLTLENISMHANRDPVLITGADMMKALEKDLTDLGVRHHPIINLAPLTVQILHQATAIQAQLIEIYNDGSLVEWGAPQFTPHIHRAVFHGFKELLAENRAGFIGDERRGYLNQQFNQDIAELTRGGYNTVVILDDRCSS